ncbi:hypothetical protein [Nitrosopumilus sp.]|uniref:hypothetical protein n=1 Tax=Nitrosopumilus sp. TaxID=2024843 RepID=UPI003B599C23
MGCKNICYRYKAERIFGVPRYESGHKRCSICEVFLEWDGRHCPCCGYMLRTKPKEGKSRQKMLVKSVKRI